MAKKNKARFFYVSSLIKNGFWTNQSGRRVLSILQLSIRLPSNFLSISDIRPLTIGQKLFVLNQTVRWKETFSIFSSFLLPF